MAFRINTSYDPDVVCSNVQDLMHKVYEFEDVIDGLSNMLSKEGIVLRSPLPGGKNTNTVELVVDGLPYTESARNVVLQAIKLYIYRQTGSVIDERKK